jgi:hypothetical protein
MMSASLRERSILSGASISDVNSTRVEVCVGLQKLHAVSLVANHCWLVVIDQKDPILEKVAGVLKTIRCG